MHVDHGRRIFEPNSYIFVFKYRVKKAVVCVTFDGTL